MPRDVSTYQSRDLDCFFLSQRATVDADLVTRLVEFIAGTKRSLDCAIYDLRHPEVIGAQEAQPDPAPREAPHRLRAPPHQVEGPGRRPEADGTRGAPPAR